MLVVFQVEDKKMAQNYGNISFSWYDYGFFSFMLLISALIGIYFGCFGNKQSSAKEYLMGGKKMKVIPISISLIASHISGLTLLAVPSDVYNYGATYGLLAISHFLTYLATIFIYLPIFYKLQITSLYEYLEKRFDARTRTLASFFFALQMLLYLPVVIYIPALALSAATGVNVHYITPVVCGVCIFYTTIGGLKAVVWTDAIQFTVTVGSMLATFYKGVSSVGGFANVWTVASEGQRLDITLGLDITERDSILAMLVGFSFGWLTHSAVNQGCVQKYLALPTYKDAKLSALYFTVGMAVVTLFSVFTGLIIYAKYATCDPITAGYISKPDQIMPYYVMDVAGSIPGLPGLFIAGIFCAALSTLSATLNCLAGTIYEDFIGKLMPKHTEKTTANMLKVIVLITGLVCTLMVYAIETFGSILALTFTLTGISAGPTLALFTIGVLYPKIRSKGAFWGSIIGLIFMACLGFTTQYYKSIGLIVHPTKPVTTAGCPMDNSTTSFMDMITSTVTSTVNNNVTSTATNTVTSTITSNMELTTIFENVTANYEDGNKPLPLIFRITYYYYTIIGACVSTIAALIINKLSNNKHEPPINKDLICPLVHFMLPKDEYYDIRTALEKVGTVMDEKK